MAAGNIIQKDTLDAWADIVLDIWKDRMMDFNVRNTGALWESLLQHVNFQASGDSNKIDFFFNYYGIYVDMGVGGEFKAGNTGEVMINGESAKRRAKPWYSKVFYSQVKRLGEILAEKYGEETAKMLVGIISASVDKRISNYHKSSNARSMRNYKRRRAEPGHWTKQGQWKIGFRLQNHNYSK